jgi:hypothetical protein
VIHRVLSLGPVIYFAALVTANAQTLPSPNAAQPHKAEADRAAVILR